LAYLHAMKMFPIAAAALAALALAGCQKASDAAFGQRVHAYLMAHPEVLEEASQKLQEKQQAEAAKASTDAVKKFRAQLERDPRDIVLNPNGKVTVVEFFDYRCGYCKLAAPEVAKIIEQNPDIRFVFKQFPIFGEVSDTAAKVALTPAARGKALALYKSWMGEKALDDNLLDQDLRAAGIDPAEARKAAEHPDIQRQILDTRVLANNLRIEGTPAFIVGDTMIPGADLPALRTAISIAKDGGLKKIS
jgi:protein-disulfide isomerase